jgi:hypothetical protein
MFFPAEQVSVRVRFCRKRRTAVQLVVSSDLVEAYIAQARYEYIRTVVPFFECCWRCVGGIVVSAILLLDVFYGTKALKPYGFFYENNVRVGFFPSHTSKFL